MIKMQLSLLSKCEKTNVVNIDENKDKRVVMCSKKIESFIFPHTKTSP
jgi:hypothetical protein